MGRSRCSVRTPQPPSCWAALARLHPLPVGAEGACVASSTPALRLASSFPLVSRKSRSRTPRADWTGLGQVRRRGPQALAPQIPGAFLTSWRCPQSSRVQAKPPQARPSGQEAIATAETQRTAPDSVYVRHTTGFAAQLVYFLSRGTIHFVSRRKTVLSIRLVLSPPPPGTGSLNRSPLAPLG